jgi:hypothetical protein
LGKSCTAECHCKGTCNNAFNAVHKTRVFGSDLYFYGRELQPNACFVKWFAKKRSTDREHIDMEYLYQQCLMKLKSNWSTWAEACSRDDKLKEF